jgi:hypothetical protein
MIAHRGRPYLVMQMMAELKPPNERTFGGYVRVSLSLSLFSLSIYRTHLPEILYSIYRLVRGPDGRFADDDLARILHDPTQYPGGAWRARGTPEVLRVIEIVGIMQARQWGVCTVRISRFRGSFVYADVGVWG